MKVELLSFTPDALNLLLRTKGTRLKHSADPADWSPEEKAEHLEYMIDTIKSSWEFVDYTFRISGVSRAFTHQLVRTRTGSYAQEAQRAVVADAAWYVPDGFDESDYYPGILYSASCRRAFEDYEALLNEGVARQDARGVLPTATLTSIVAKFNLRTLHDMAKLRLCTRTQGEYQTVFRSMRALVLEQHPWADPFIQVHCVATGTCAFPRYGKADCPFYDLRMDNDALKMELKGRFWSEQSIHNAAPNATGGMAS